jgi:hypothetical protein
MTLWPATSSVKQSHTAMLATCAFIAGDRLPQVYSTFGSSINPEVES